MRQRTAAHRSDPMQYRGPEGVAGCARSPCRKGWLEKRSGHIHTLGSPATRVHGDDQAAMSHQPPADRPLLDPTLEEGLAVDDETIRALETDVRLATHLRALSSVSVATAHDIRTPLHTIVLYLELLRNTVAEPPGTDRHERQTRYIEVVSSELKRLETMLDNLLAQMRLGDNRRERRDLVAMVQEILEFLEPQRRRVRIEIAWDPPAGPVLVESEADSVRHALTHLLVLAIEATSEGETLRVQVDARDDRARIRISGSALLADRMREENGRPRLAGATRGLAVARQVVERHHGTIDIRTGASRAATLEIELPRLAVEDR